MLKKKKWEKKTRKEKNQIINNYFYSNHEEQKLLIIATLICLVLIYFNAYMIILHILFIMCFYYKLTIKAQTWYQKNEIFKPKFKGNKPYKELKDNEKKEVQEAYKLCKSTAMLDDFIVYLAFSYSLVFFLKGIFSAGILLIIFIFVDIFLLYDLKCTTKWYEKTIKNR